MKLKYMVTYVGSFPFESPNHGFLLVKEKFFSNKRKAKKFFKEETKRIKGCLNYYSDYINAKSVKMYKLEEMNEEMK